MTVLELCKKIELQDEIAARVCEISSEFDFSPVEKLIEGLATEDSSAESYRAIKETLGEDPRALKILCCYLRAALLTYEKYKEMEIGDGIFFDTMKCFTRFIEECFEKTGELAFDRAFWTHRQTSAVLMRIGTLEFERKIREGKRVISLHIPSDADLSSEALDDSFAAARRLISEKFGEYADAPFVCESWLLYDGLDAVLNEDSKILAFKRRFDMQYQNPPSDSNLVWIFRRADCSDYANLPESTSLQRNVKRLLLNGGGIGSGYGIYKCENN